MTRLPLTLRVFWGAFFLAAFGLLVALPAGPTLETWIAPVREPGAQIENVGRDAAFLWFDWVGIKHRTPSSPGVDVTMQAAGDLFHLGLYNDESIPGEPRCTRTIPWARSRIIGPGFHRQAFCVEIPRTVTAGDSISLAVVPRYRGLLGLWELRTPFPLIAVPGAKVSPR